ncbi:selenium-dependent xanthine dehydrogenase [Sedimentibacter acidaminivorans]|uniref:Selenium-dependent xanthine dehydrogenase n=1 Tax=Sedimentibacter acidaminivorans TaxID=913099 RepID=A0ABS4GDP6_9FIRM|nr:selenium-dependent xanthine dehydrogenase [Sedimentibacter acidaminivorans]MBP1925772.1 selenium-dependent xanthine dehydrogenase [Sedimentibacter acidaminivorans]
MYSLNVNGKLYEVEKDKSLMSYLRDDLGLTAVKNGCDEGACGACSVIADGKVIRACIMRVSKVEGKKIVTVEGLTERERDVYSYAFAKCGAVQCGFCIPGMVISAKALIDQNNNPTKIDVKKAIKGNICRCTGYVKIEEAIMLAAQIFRNNEEIPYNEDAVNIGKSIFRVDARDKTLGEAKYVDDIVVEGMVYGKAIRPPYARCKVISINKDKALKLDGVIGVYTAEDIPGERFIGHIKRDWPVMIAVGEETRYVGDAVALVVADTKEKLEEAIKLVEIKYEKLTPINNPKEAAADGAPFIHNGGNLLSLQTLKRGDVEVAFEKAKYISEYNYKTPFTEHAFLEPECAIGVPDGDGVKVITGGQGIYDEYREITEMLGIDSSKVRIQSAYVGGGFGGKEDMSVQHHAGLLAYLSKKPVKVLLSRQESIKIHPKRHAMEIYMKVACDENGKLLGMISRIISDTGAYASLGGPVLQRACTHAAGPYNYQNVDIEGKAYYTNNPPAGAFRGFGVTQSCFAMESTLNDLAEKVGISPWEIRYLNAIRPGEVLPNGQIADEGTAFAETLEAVKEVYENLSQDESKFVGIASAMKNAGLGVGVPDIGRCNIFVQDGIARIRSSASGIGQGLQTIIYQVVCETTGLNPKQVVIEQPDTKYTPNSGTTTASRQTVFTGEATRRASLKLKEALKEKSIEELEGELFSGEYSFESDPMGSDKPNPVSHVSYGYATQVVILNKEGIVEKVVAAHDIGHAINPVTASGQIDGGVIMSLGYGLTEDFPLKDGVPQAKFGTLGLLRSVQSPEIETILIEKNKEELAYGAKGIGEIAAIPAAPAVQNAYYKKDGKFRTTLPLENTAYKK